MKSFEIRHLLDAGSTPGGEEVNNQRAARKDSKGPVLSFKGRKFKKVQTFISLARNIVTI
tara:strand:- start:5270 stop:5449 length:180 start_codon:yes stop_codon:yes gene_type:complete